MRAFPARYFFLAGIVFPILVGTLAACGQKTETKTTTVATVPVDTAVVDDDTLEVSDSASLKQTERAR